MYDVAGLNRLARVQSAPLISGCSKVNNKNNKHTIKNLHIFPSTQSIDTHYCVVHFQNLYAGLRTAIVGGPNGKFIVNMGKRAWILVLNALFLVLDALNMHVYVFRIESKYSSSYIREGMQRGYHERIPKILAIVVQRPTPVVFGIHQKPPLPGTVILCGGNR